MDRQAPDESSNIGPTHVNIFSGKRSDEFANTGAYECADIFADESANARTRVANSCPQLAQQPVHTIPSTTPTSSPTSVPTSGATPVPTACRHLGRACHELRRILLDTGAGIPMPRMRPCLDTGLSISMSKIRHRLNTVWVSHAQAEALAGHGRAHSQEIEYGAPRRRRTSNPTLTSYMTDDAPGLHTSASSPASVQTNPRSGLAASPANRQRTHQCGQQLSAAGPTPGPHHTIINSDIPMPRVRP